MNSVNIQSQNGKWEKVKLGTLLKIRRGASPRPIHEFITESGMPWLKIADVTSSDSRYVDHTKEFIKKEGLAKSVVVRPGDLILSNSATPGIPRFMRITACVHDGWLILEPLGNFIDKDYLYYRLVIDRSKLISNVTGAVFDNLKTDVLREHEIPLPTLAEQKKIASILSAFDDKIELNNKIAKTLEEMAQTIFKEWFINFRFPGHEKTKFVDSELGNIPEGWTTSRFSEYARLEYGKALKEENRKSGDIPVYGSSGRVGFHNEKLCPGPGIVVGRKGNVGSVFWINEDFYPIDTTFYVSTNNSIYYIYFLLKNLRFHTGDSAVPGLNRDSVYNREIIVPDEELINKFEFFVKPLFEKNNLIQKENQKLAALRDLLLPKLMKGEIRI